MKSIKFYLVITLLISVGCTRSDQKLTTGDLDITAHAFQVDPFWPKPLPNDWLVGQVAGVAVDSKDNIWIMQRPHRLGEDEASPVIPADQLPYALAPEIIQFDPEGNVLQAWGGPNENYEWPVSGHGIYIDYEDNVWIGGGNPEMDHQVLKFRPDGTFLLQIGKAGYTGGNNATDLLGIPTEIAVDSAANEVFISDGYLNNRVIVFDATTGEYKRHWGAYGNRPDDYYKDPNYTREAALQHFRTVHDVRLSHDGLVYVADRVNNRIQVFNKDGSFVFEEFIADGTPALGSVWAMEFSPDPEQTYMYVTDGSNQCIWILNREDLQVIDKFGRIGRYAGQFIWVHSIAVDSKGNIYATEVRTGKRVQKFSYQAGYAH